MSRTDHARPRRIRARGHRVEIRRPAMFFGEHGHQAVCSCGEVGWIRQGYDAAAEDKAHHIAEQQGLHR